MFIELSQEQSTATSVNKMVAVAVNIIDIQLVVPNNTGSIVKFTNGHFERFLESYTEVMKRIRLELKDI